ncbi:hypothetical protein H2204_004910 [Knufia peltigerae]|uniref:AB hydrolase-1 domain-containing protein n=1 Tax=Knufia peltigerae TaxID=1002370 RepID=A0AA38Y6R7_9EURO|nr:hypothetical protein H2204_004910 [Knufia peltigerae]
MERARNILSTLDDSQLPSIEAAINEDAACRAAFAGVDVCFDVQSWDNPEEGLIFYIHKGLAEVELLRTSTYIPEFNLSARSQHWNEFFSKTPTRPFQSYWGMLRLLGTESHVEVGGDLAEFTTHALVWRIILDKTREAVTGQRGQKDAAQDYVSDDECDDDSIVGHYTWLSLPGVGKCKIFYETSGQGDQPILFLHTAGADSRQFHSMMMNGYLQRRYRMVAFDLPGHGRSFPGSQQHPLSYANSEEFYISAIKGIISKLGLRDVIVSGASMGGQVCLAVALRAAELNVSGVIPCEACDYLPRQQAQSIYGLSGDESVLNPERVCGMMAPTSPEIYKRLNWWLYSAQASRIFPGDLMFYFEGWDGRDRMALIDTTACPVYMLTGEYDYSCSPETSQKTAAKIRGAVFEEMKGLGHFPFSENPEKFMPYFKRALDHIRRSRG